MILRNLGENSSTLYTLDVALNITSSIDLRIQLGTALSDITVAVAATHQKFVKHAIEYFLSQDQYNST